MYEKICEYLNWKREHGARASVTYKKPLTRFVEICGDKPIEKYVIGDVVTYSRMLREKFANETVRYALIVIKDFFLFYREQRYRCISPKLIKLPKKRPPNSHRAVKESEVRSMLAAVEGNDIIAQRNRLIMLFFWKTGVRVSELCRLWTTEFNPAEMQMLVGTAKRDILRIIIWDKEAHDYLLLYLETHKKHYKGHGTLPLFMDTRERKNMRAITSRTVERIIKYYARKAGITKKVTPHSFRHGWANARRDRGLPLSFIQKGLGHTNPASTMVYQQFSDPDFVRVASEFFRSPYYQPELPHPEGSVVLA